MKSIEEKIKSVDSGNTILASMKELAIGSGVGGGGGGGGGCCACKIKPCTCDPNSVRTLPLGFALPNLNPHITALPTSPELFHQLINLRALTQSCYNPRIQKYMTPNVNSFADLPNHVVSSSNQDLCFRISQPNKRRQKKEEEVSISSASPSPQSPPICTSSSSSSTSSSSTKSNRNSKNNYNNNNNNSISDNNHNRAASTQTNDRTNIKGRKFVCNMCSRSFDYKHVLLNHERTHTGEKPFECTNCKKRFTRDHHLKTHIRLHTGEKPFICDYCDKKFVQVANLRRHVRVHTGERPYICNYRSCKLRFSDSNQLNTHRLKHEESSQQETEVPQKMRKLVEPMTITSPPPCEQMECNYLAYYPGTKEQEQPEDLSLKKHRVKNNISFS